MPAAIETKTENLEDLKNNALRIKQSLRETGKEIFLMMKLLEKADAGSEPNLVDTLCIKSNQIIARCDDKEKDLDQATDQLAHFMSKIDGYDDNNGSLVTYHHLSKFFKMWKKSPECFERLLLNIDHQGELEPITVDQVIAASRKHRYIGIISLSKNDNGDIFVHGPGGFKSSPCFACHVSGGSVHGMANKKGWYYRHVNFLTESGSVYYGTGLDIDEKSNNILGGLYIMSKEMM